MALHQESSNQSQIMAKVDELGKIRFLDPVVFDDSERLGEDSRSFSKASSMIIENSGAMLKTMNQRASEAEALKLKAIGLRSAAEREANERDTKELKIKALIHERQVELERLQARNASLQKALEEHHSIIDVLSAK